MNGAAPKRVYLHVGLHKTGTTYLQNVMAANRDQLRSAGVYYPGGPGDPRQVHAVWDFRGKRPRGVSDRRIAGSWDRLAERINTCGLPTALISAEGLSGCTARQAVRAVHAFPDSEVVIIVTARDLARVVVSQWQESVKSDATWTWGEFVGAIKDPDRAGSNPARGFWIMHDVTAVCAAWASGVSTERLVVVTVPRSGSPADELLERVASVIGVPMTALTQRQRWDNPMIGPEAVEVLRRVNERLGDRLNQRQYERVIKGTLVPLLAAHGESRFDVPPEEIPWLAERADAFIEDLVARGYPVVGDLEELRPVRREGGRRPDSATEADTLAAAVDSLALLAEAYANAWWQHRRGDIEGAAESRNIRSLMRQVTFSGQRKVLRLADRNALVAKAVGSTVERRRRRRGEPRG